MTLSRNEVGGVAASREGMAKVCVLGDGVKNVLELYTEGKRGGKIEQKCRAILWNFDKCFYVFFLFG